jgi:acetate kinase
MPQAHVLVVNCGSSSIKLALLAPETGEMPWQAIAERIDSEDASLEIRPARGARSAIALPGANHDRALDAALGQLPALPIAGVGHRVVHGGESFSDSVVIDARVIEAIAACSDLAPLHNPANLSGIRDALRKLPDVGHVAVFDTAFHQTMPQRAFVYALPYRLYEQYKVRKYGFHGTSHRYVAGAAAELIGRSLRELNLISAHLGNGCSATAIAGGRSVDTTMGLTPLEGLVMGTRSGDVDPNLHAFLVEHAGMDLVAVSDLLNEQSGLLGLSGESNDMRTLLELEREGSARAALAIEVFCYRLAKALLGLSAALPSVDALVFTGGIGENAAPVRERTVRMMSMCGAKLDPALNADHGRSSHGVISDATSRVRVLVVPTHEELVIAREVVRLLAPA